MTNLLCLFLLIQPWVFIPNLKIQFRIPQEAFLTLFFMAMMCFSRKKDYSNKYLAIFSGFVFLNIVWNYLRPYTLQQPVGLHIISPTILFILGLGATYSVLTNDIDYKKIGKALYISSILISLFVILQKIGLDPFGSFAKYRIVEGHRISACLDNPDLVGNYLCLTIPLLFYFRNWLGILSSGVAVWATDYKFGFILYGIAILLSLMFYFRRRLWFWVSYFVGILGIAFYKPIWAFLISDERIGLWQKVFFLLKHNPLFGIGLGRYKTMNITFVTETTRWLEVHNDFYQYAIELGLLTVVAFLLLCSKTLLKFDFTNPFYTVFIIFLLMMIGSFPIEQPSIGVIGLVSFWALERKT